MLFGEGLAIFTNTDSGGEGGAGGESRAVDGLILM